VGVRRRYHGRVTVLLYVLGVMALLAGLPFGPVGILAGPVAGAVVLELWKDPDLERALKAGLGTLVGFLVGSVVKVVLAFLLLAALVVGLLV